MSIGSIHFGPGGLVGFPDNLEIQRFDTAKRLFVEFAAEAHKQNWTKEECVADAYAWADAFLSNDKEVA